MKPKLFFWILAVLVFGALAAGGFLFIHSDIRKFLILEGIALLAVVLFVILYIRLIKPYHIISSGMELIKEQDFSSRLRPIANSEANTLIETFNKMMEQLREERLQVREKNQFLDLLIKASPQGVIILDYDDHITEINPAGLALLHIDDIERVKGKFLYELQHPIGSALAALKPDEDTIVRGTGILTYRCARSSFLDRGFAHPFILVEELTRELLATEKKSYESVIRMMAHEVNNSVAAIGSTLNVISDALKEDDSHPLKEALPAVDASFDRCKNLGVFISNFSEVVKIPKPTFNSVNINELTRSVEALSILECRKRAIDLVLTLDVENPVAELDRIQFEQALVNIVKNACEAIGENGEIRIVTNSSPLSITVSDNGTGISNAVKQKLFTPFFTTKPSGQGIGLMFVREVLTNHACDFDLKTENGRTMFEIFLKRQKELRRE